MSEGNKIESIAEELIAMKNADLELRSLLLERGTLSDAYHPEMEQLHIKHAQRLQVIIDEIDSYPTAEMIGTEASNAAWLIIQHAISLPHFMRRCRDLLSDAVKNGTASPEQLAYLMDRIAVLEGRPQLYGTQYDWNEDGRLSPKPVDDPIKVDERRASLGWASMDNHTRRLNDQAKATGEKPPTNPFIKRKAYNLWRKKVGWIKDTDHDTPSC